MASARADRMFNSQAYGRSSPSDLRHRIATLEAENRTLRAERDAAWASRAAFVAKFETVSSLLVKCLTQAPPTDAE